MRLPQTPPFFLFLTLLLGASASTQEQDFNDNVAEANFKLGIGYMQSGHFQVATEKLLKALQFKDNYPEAHNAIAVLYEETREYGPAENHYKRAIDLKPDYTLARLNYARFLCLRDRARVGEGESELQRIVSNYSVRFARATSLPLKVGREAAAPEWYLYDDTTAIKATASRLGQQVNFSFEAKKRESKGLYRFTGLAEKSTFSGNVLLAFR